MDWTSVPYLNQHDFIGYLDTLTQDDRAQEIKIFSQREGVRLLKKHMKEEQDFYNFMAIFSPPDFKIIKGKEYVSQRVVSTHVKYWNDTHPQCQIKTLRVFFM
jgi:hypothetical protein